MKLAALVAVVLGLATADVAEAGFFRKRCCSGNRVRLFNGRVFTGSRIRIIRRTYTHCPVQEAAAEESPAVEATPQAAPEATPAPATTFNLTDPASQAAPESPSVGPPAPSETPEAPTAQDAIEAQEEQTEAPETVQETPQPFRLLPMETTPRVVQDPPQTNQATPDNTDGFKLAPRGPSRLQRSPGAIPPASSTTGVN